MLNESVSYHTTKNAVISSNFLVWKLCGNCAFPQNIHTRKLGEITVLHHHPIFPIQCHHSIFSNILQQSEQEEHKGPSPNFASNIKRIEVN